MVSALRSSSFIMNKYYDAFTLWRLKYFRSGFRLLELSKSNQKYDMYVVQRYLFNKISSGIYNYNKYQVE